MQSTRAWAVRIIDDQDQRVKDISRLMVCFYVHHHIMQPGTWEIEVRRGLYPTINLDKSTQQIYY